jgi:hypothetical protein
MLNNQQSVQHYETSMKISALIEQHSNEQAAACECVN